MRVIIPNYCNIQHLLYSTHFLFVLIYLLFRLNFLLNFITIECLQMISGDEVRKKLSPFQWALLAKCVRQTHLILYQDLIRHDCLRVELLAFGLCKLIHDEWVLILDHVPNHLLNFQLSVIGLSSSE